MNGVESVEQSGPTHSRWTTWVGGVERVFETEITEQHPDERVAWASVDGKQHAGVAPGFPPAQRHHHPCHCAA